MKKIIITALSVLSFIPVLVLAHPGNTDSSGCHTCRTNCPKWGLSYGEYHCHNSKPSIPKTVQPTVPKNPPKPIVQPVVQEVIKNEPIVKKEIPQFEQKPKTTPIATSSYVKNEAVKKNNFFSFFKRVFSRN